MPAEADTMLIAKVRIDTLLSHLPLHPYRSPAWSCAPFTITDVLACSAPDPGPYDNWAGLAEPAEERLLHIARIAHLMQAWRNDGTDTPDLHVYRGLTLLDGWHRLAAAIARGEQELFVALDGSLDEAAAYGITAVDDSEIGRG